MLNVANEPMNMGELSHKQIMRKSPVQVTRTKTRNEKLQTTSLLCQRDIVVVVVVVFGFFPLYRSYGKRGSNKKSKLL
jgi:hypothetical protein